MLPLLQRLAREGGQGRQHSTNIVAEPSRCGVHARGNWCMTANPSFSSAALGGQSNIAVCLCNSVFTHGSF